MYTHPRLEQRRQRNVHFMDDNLSKHIKNLENDNRRQRFEPFFDDCPSYYDSSGLEDYQGKLPRDFRNRV